MHQRLIKHRKHKTERLNNIKCNTVYNFILAIFDLELQSAFEVLVLKNHTYMQNCVLGRS